MKLEEVAIVLLVTNLLVALTIFLFLSITRITYN